MFTCRILTFYFGSKVAIVNKLVTGSSPPIVGNLDQLMGQGGGGGTEAAAACSNVVHTTASNNSSSARAFTYGVLAGRGRRAC
jgi:hypothetical protein